MLRISLSVLLVAVFAVAFGCAALIQSNRIWQQITYTVLFSLLIAATLIAASSNRPFRWFWFGFSLAGWLYVAAILFGGIGVYDLLLTDKALQLIYEGTGMDKRVDKEVIFVVEGGFIWHIPGQLQRSISEDQAAQLGLYNLSYTDVSTTRFRFHRIGHALWAVILGTTAGVFTFWARYRDASSIQAR